jgi:hypothetical protein
MCMREVRAVRSALAHYPVETELSLHDKSTQNSLLTAISGITTHIGDLKEKTKEYYFEVLLSLYPCPSCGGKLHMTGQSECSCLCGNIFDPTLAFQKSPCCGATLIRKTFHYACSRCHKMVPSKFLFDERLFDTTYFREMMQESRRRAKEKRDEVKRILAESRSDTLPLMEDPDLDSIPGLIQDLNAFIQDNPIELAQVAFDTQSQFNMDDYRQHILSTLGWSETLFSTIDPFTEDARLDRVWRFITLIFMENDGEIELTQYGNDIVIQRTHNEAYN